MISQKLQDLYANHNNTNLYYDAIALSHPAFAGGEELYPSDVLYPSDELYANQGAFKSSYFLIRAEEDMQFNVADKLTLFTAFPFSVVAPEQGSDQQDFGIVLDNVARELISNIENASEYEDEFGNTPPIKMTYYIFIDGELESQIAPITLSLTNLSVDMQTVQATATRVDLYARKFPFGNTSTFDRKFKGLYL